MNNLLRNEGVDCKDLLRAADKDIKVINYKLQSVIVSGDNCKMISPQMKYLVELVEETPLYYKVPTNGQNYSMVFFISYLGDSPSRDVKVYISTDHSNPQKHNASKSFSNEPYKFAFKPGVNK